jgi:hypothetical protein
MNLAVVSQTNIEESDQIESIHWVLGLLGLRTILDIMKVDNCNNSNRISTLEARSIDGRILNTITVDLGQEQLTSINLGLLFNSEFFTNGEKIQGLVIVRSPKNFIHQLRLVSNDSNHRVKGFFPVQRTAPFFFFLPRELGCNIYMGISYAGNEPLPVQTRLFFKNSYREIEKIVLPNGCVLFRPEIDFKEIVESESEQPLMVRVSIKSERDIIGVHIIESRTLKNGGTQYIGIS